MKQKRKTLDERLRALMLTILIPMLLFVLGTLILFLVYNLYYSRISGNVIKASQFSQNFKTEIDLKMYYFAVESEFSEGLPYDEVNAALSIAEDLSKTTLIKENQRTIEQVMRLFNNLKASMSQMSQTEAYERRIEQLESNIYVITDMIQYYMSNYLYSAARHLARAYQIMKYALYVFFIIVPIGMALLIFTLVRKQMRLAASITQPIDALYARMEELGRGVLTPRTPVQAEDTRLQALSDGLEHMAGQLEHQMELNRIEAEQLRRMEFLLIQAQINPHFLYNTLDTIIWLIEAGKNEQAIQVVSNLSSFFRLSLSNGREVITLQEELLHVKSYLEIQQVRYKDVLTYQLITDTALDGKKIPKLTLQPLVENALYHGIKLKRGIGCITVESRREGDDALLYVRDDGVGMTKERLSQVQEGLRSGEGTGFGTAAVYKRLQILFNGKCGFKISSTPGVGTEIEIRLPGLDELPNAAMEEHL